jgi:murein L,D-transpeptidase YafK
MRPQRRLGAGFVIALVTGVFVAGLAIALLFNPGFTSDPVQRAIERQRAFNLALATAGQPLPGTPDLADLDGRLKAHGVALGAPVLIRVFKQSFELEVWLARDGRFTKFATYPICRWSGRLGPKLATGDRQAPEGFYSVASSQMNPSSRWHRSFNLGFPNAFDAAHGRTGAALMVHGGCSSVGCFAMTNAVIDEIWRITTAAQTLGKQKRFQVQVYPFRMDGDVLIAHTGSPHLGLWQQLKQGNDLFEATLLPPAVSVCSGRYTFKPAKGLAAADAAIAACSDTTPAIDGKAVVHLTKKAL